MSSRFSSGIRGDRDSNLSPITPIGYGESAFNFKSPALSSQRHQVSRKTNFRGLRPSRLAAAISKPKSPPKFSRSFSTVSRNFSEDFMRRRSVFSPSAQSTMDSGYTSRNDRSNTYSVSSATANSSERSRIKRESICKSPVNSSQLSPRIRSVFNRTGNSHLTGMLTRQEINIETLLRMTVEDLEALGVRGAKELKLALDIIKFAKRLFSK